MRSCIQIRICGAVAMLLASPAAGIAQTQQPGSPVECVDRGETAEPPPLPAAPKHRASRGGGELKAESTAKPVCPEGQVPVVREQRIERERQMPPKGNPLLRPRPGVEMRPESGAPGAVHSFREIYRSKPALKSGAAVTPAAPACAGVPSFGSCYYYASAGLVRAADGGGMVISVNRPAYDGGGGPGHALDEIAVQGGPGNGNIVELGWLVSTDQNRDPDPHIFVFHWKGWNPTCYNGCGWRQYSNTYFPGQNIRALVGREVYVGYVFYKGNWWAWFDGQWLGYFPGTEWDGSYVKTALLQWFGEVASQNGVPPKTQMGDGTLPPSSNAALMFALCDVDANAWRCRSRDQQSLTATVPRYYDIRRVGSGDTRYGGPGQ